MLGFFRSSAVPFMAVVFVGVVAGPFSTYLIREDVRLRGQPPYIFVVLILFVVAFVLWLLYRGNSVASRTSQWVLAGAGLLWLSNLVLARVHGDPLNHTVWLMPVFLVMLALKCPPWRDLRSALVILGYALALMLTTAYLLEASGIMEPLYLPDGITEFQRTQYWLPLDGLPGIDGRWTGPLGHNTRAGLAAAFVFVLGVARWAPVSVPLVAIGAYFLLATSVRASYLSALAGVGIVLLFSQRSIMGQITVPIKWLIVLGLTLLAGIGFALTGAGLTGRDTTIWPAFVGLIPNSPVIGVGASGIQEAGGTAAISGDAHNLFLDQLVRYGVIGLAALVIFGAIVVVTNFRAANRGFTLPAAVLTVYVIASQTDIQNDWLSFSYQSLIVIVTALLAAQWLDSNARVSSVTVQS